MIAEATTWADVALVGICAGFCLAWLAIMVWATK